MKNPEDPKGVREREIKRERIGEGRSRGGDSGGSMAERVKQKILVQNG